METQNILRLLDDNADRFEKYYRLLVEWNEKINLTAITDRAEVQVKHFEDSLYGLEFIPQNASVCDVGTGAGFPGVPLKIARDDLKLTLVDSLNKRVNFLQNVSDALSLSVDCLHLRAEDAGQGRLRECFDVITARAVAKLNTLCEYCLPLVKVGGRFLAYKAAADDEIAQSQNAVQILGGKVEEVKKFCLSNGDSRTIVVIKKVKPTPPKYPRGKGKEKSMPL